MARTHVHNDRSPNQSANLRMAGDSDDGEFTALNDDLPLLLLPIRIETRFFPEDGNLLKVRIYPDMVQADTLVRGIADSEVQLGQEFWHSVWPLETDQTTYYSQFEWLCNHLTPWRAGYVAKMTRPTNWSARDGVITPVFPIPDPRELDSPGLAKLMPKRFLVTGYRHGTQVFSEWGANIDHANLFISPDFHTGLSPANASDFLSGQGLEWLSDYDEALTKGMAVTIALGSTSYDGFLDELIVVGVSTDSSSDAEGGLKALLRAHLFTHGVDFMAPGTPTNQTEWAETGISVNHPETDGVADTLLTPHSTRSESSFPMARQAYADGLAKALGLSGAHVLDELPQAGNRRQNFSAAMNAILWPATLGYGLRHMLNVGLSESTLTQLRQHFINYVRASGPLPPLRLGAQPYGVLPLQRFGSPSGGGFVDQLHSVLAALQPHWQASRYGIPKLDPETIDPTSESQIAHSMSDVAKILGQLPDPALFVTREIEDKGGEYAAQHFTLLTILALAVPDTSDLHPLAEAFASAYSSSTTSEAKTANIVGYVAELQRVQGDPAYSDEDQALAQAVINYLNDYFLPLWEVHQERMQPILDLGVDRSEVNGLVFQASNNPTLFYGMFDEAGIKSETPLTSPEAGEGAQSQIIDYLDAFITHVNTDGETPAHWSGEGEPPLLFQLINWSATEVKDADKAALVGGLTGLRDALVSGEIPDGQMLLGQLLRETLGLVSHRLDAWITSLATRQLEEKRNAHAQGIQVGAFGFVTDLKPRAAAEKDGYIFTPDLNLAATAAVLRSGFKAMGEGSSHAPMAVNLSSERLRRAQWLISGVNGGQDLGDLLGYAFERRLHDADLAHHIGPLRALMREATTEDGPLDLRGVDGLLLSRAYTESVTSPRNEAEEAIRVAIDAYLDTLTDSAAVSKLEGILRALVEDFDAVADALTAQSVHSLLQGNSATASAALSSMGSGPGVLPEITFADSRQDSVAIHHRQCLILPESGGYTSLWSVHNKPIAIAEPRLELFAAKVLGDPSQYKYLQFTTDLDGNETFTKHSLAELDLSALEAVLAAPRGDSTEGSTLEALALLRARTHAAHPDETHRFLLQDLPALPQNELPMEDFMAVAQSLRQVIFGGRALDIPDFDPIGVVSASGHDGDELASRADDLFTHFDSAFGTLADEILSVEGGGACGPLIAAMRRLWSYGFAQAFAQNGHRAAAGLDDDGTDRQALLAEANALKALATTRQEAALILQVADDAATVEGATARLRQLLARNSFPFLPLFTLLDGPAMDANRMRTLDRVDHLSDCQEWLGQVSHTRPGAGALYPCIDLTEACRDQAVFRLDIAQLPDYPAEKWVAQNPPTEDDKSRLSILMARVGPVHFSDETGPLPVAGLWLDAFVEAVPKATTNAGIAVQFDAPSTRPPQVMLLAQTAPGETWGVDLVLDLMRQTLSHMKDRAVGPESLQGLGQYLPAIYLNQTSSSDEEGA